MVTSFVFFISNMHSLRLNVFKLYFLSVPFKSLVVQLPGLFFVSCFFLRCFGDGMSILEYK